MLDIIRQLVILKSNISDVYSYKYKKIKINSNDDLLLEKAINMNYLVILAKYVFNTNHSCYYYQVKLENLSNK